MSQTTPFGKYDLLRMIAAGDRPEPEHLEALAKLTGTTPETVARWFSAPRVGAILGVTETAELLGIGHNLVRALFQDGEIRAKKVGRAWKTTTAAVVEYIEGRDQEPNTN